jgi:hypothetical protein
MTANAVSDAIDLLRQRRADAVRQQRELVDEVRKIDEALNALGGLPSTGALPPTSDEAAKPTAKATRPSVRFAVITILEDGAKEWSPAELVSEIQRRGFDVKVTKLGDAVRTALWGLGKDGKVARQSSSQYIATKWLSQSEKSQLPVSPAQLPVHRRGRKSVRQMVVDLLEEEDRSWTPPEIANELERRGERFATPDARDRTKSLRHALQDNERRRLVSRLEDGSYVAEKHRHQPFLTSLRSAPSQGVG